MPIEPRFLLVVSLALTLNISSASAVVLWDESVDGDLPVWPPLPTFKLSAPTSEIIGSTCYVAGPTPPCGPGGGDTADADTFAFVVPNHARLISISFQYTPTFVTFAGSNWGRIVWALLDDKDAKIGADEIIFTTEVTSNELLFEPQLPLGSGTYVFGTSQLGASNGWIADYTITLKIARIQEPTTLVLLGLGLAGLGFSRRKQ